ncbi:hypothetical protein DFH08DRAFT_1084861 [Mycena albidolilacea]|uniref:Uncharacterized protein n=1 Tax=Mycena albidolilacea TaxID=1033008 RepID=A0AAD6ZKV0_9AGAR|nr:hypothetical protein DFH08DRAFT_1084861 [Mycena albidolilacea]
MSSKRVLTPTQYRLIQDLTGDGHLPLKVQTPRDPLDSPNLSPDEEDQFRLIQDVSDAHLPLKVQTPRSLRWDLPALDSPNLSPCEEDVTLCYALRSSECDLTACASISSGLKMKNSSLPSSLALLLQAADLPEIPDWYEDQPLKQEPEPKRTTIPVLCTPTLDTPQSDYHSLLDYHPTSLCCQDILVELAATGQCIDTATPELSSSKHEPKAPQTMPQQAPSHSHWCPQPLRRSYSLVLGERRASEFPYMIPLDVGLGCGLGSPFSPSPISFPIDSDSDFLPQPAELQCTSPALSLAMNSNNLYLSPSSPGARRLEALSVWRPRAPLPPPHAASPSEDDLRSLEQPFPSTASIWVLDQPSLRPRPLPPPSSALPQSAPASSREATQHGDKKQTWTLEEQITIAVLQAMDLRDLRAAAGQQQLGLHSKLVSSSTRNSKVRKLLGRIWRRACVW